MMLLVLLSLLLSSASAVLMKSPCQEVLSMDSRDKVLGYNHAYFCSANREDDLFRIKDLTVMPDPIQT